MLNDLFSQVPGEDEIDFSLFEDADDDNGEGLGALGRKRRKRRKTTARKRTRKRRRRRVSGLASTVKLSSLGRKRKRKRRKRRLKGLKGLGRVTRRRRRRRGIISTRKGQIRTTARAAYRRSPARRKVRRRIRRLNRKATRARRRITRTRRKRNLRGLSGTRGLGFFSSKENQPIVGGFNWSMGTKDGRMSLVGIAAGGLINGLVEKVVFDKFLKNVKFLYPENIDTTTGKPVVPVFRPILSTAIASIAGWEIGKLAKSKDFAKFAFLYPWGKLIEEMIVAKAVDKISEIGDKNKADTSGFGHSSFGQLRVPDSTELDGLGQLRVPDSTELDGYGGGGLGQLRIPDLDLDGVGVESGMGQFDIDEEEDEDSEVF